MFNFKCFINQKNLFLNVKRLCQKSSTKDLIKNPPNEINLENLNSDTARNLKKLEKIIPINEIDKKTINDIIKYKVMEDSIPEAVEKIKADVPEISNHVEFRNWIKSVIDQDKQEEVLHKEGIIILKNKTDVFNKYGIDTHNYRRFHDREYEIDIQEILTKDLFEKQRVVDNFVEENKSQINDLVGYYSNRFKYLKFNKYCYLIYQNNYKMNKVKFNFIKNISAISILSALFIYVNPLYILLLLPDYLSIIFYSYFLNNLIDHIILTENKQSVFINTFNFLGFKKEIKNFPINILNLRYDKKFHNKIFNLNDKGLFLITRLIRRFYKKKPISNFDNFEYFHRIRILGKTFFFPADSSTQNEDTNEEIVINIINKNLKFILEYDYSQYENRMHEFVTQLNEFKKKFAEKSHSRYYSEDDKLRDLYSKHKPNRDYSDHKYEITLKRADDIDGSYIDNGYR